MQTIVIATRVIRQLKGDRRFLALSLIAPLFIIYFLKLLFEGLQPEPSPMPAMPGMMRPVIPVGKFMMPAMAFIVHFLSFVLCTLLLVQERTRGTLERMLITGFHKTAIIGGYTIGYFGLATLQTLVVTAEAIWLFEADFDFKSLTMLFLVVWILSIVSVMLGIFISTFARHEGHVIPFIPMILLPSVFLTGVIVDPDKLPGWAEFIGYLLPLRYANNIISRIGEANFTFVDALPDFVILIGYAVGLLFIASLTMKETE